MRSARSHGAPTTGPRIQSTRTFSAAAYGTGATLLFSGHGAHAHPTRRLFREIVNKEGTGTAYRFEPPQLHHCASESLLIGCAVQQVRADCQVSAFHAARDVNVGLGEFTKWQNSHRQLARSRIV